MANKLKKCYDFSVNYAIEILFILISALYFLCCVANSCFFLEFTICFAILMIFCAYFWLFYILNKCERIKGNIIKIAIFFISIILYSIWNVIAKTAPVSDYEVLVNGAKSLLNGDFATLSFDKQNYFYFCNYQTGYVIYLALIMKIFGTSLTALKIIEILILSFSNVLVYTIIQKLYSNKAALIASVLYMTLLFNISGSSIINNQHISALFILLAIYFFIKDKKYLSKILCGLFLAISIILRPSAIIVLIAFICFMIWRLFITSFKHWKKILTVFLIIICATTFSIKTYDFILKELRVVPVSAVSSNAKYYKFIWGIHEGDGLSGKPAKSAEKSQLYYDLEYYDFDYDEYNEACKEYLKNKISSRDGLLSATKYIAKRMGYFMGSMDNQIMFSVDENTIKQSFGIYNYLGYAQYFLLIFGMVIFAIYNILSAKKKSDIAKENYDVLFKIIFIGYFLVHIFIETQTRYRYEQYLMMCFILSPQLSVFFDNLKNRVNLKFQNMKNADEVDFKN